MNIDLPQFVNQKWNKIRLGAERMKEGWIVVIDMQDGKDKWIVKSIILYDDGTCKYG